MKIILTIFNIYVVGLYHPLFYRLCEFFLLDWKNTVYIDTQIPSSYEVSQTPSLDLTLETEQRVAVLLQPVTLEMIRRWSKEAHITPDEVEVQIKNKAIKEVQDASAHMKQVNSTLQQSFTNAKVPPNEDITPETDEFVPSLMTEDSDTDNPVVKKTILRSSQTIEYTMSPMNLLLQAPEALSLVATKDFDSFKLTTFTDLQTQMYSSHVQLRSTATITTDFPEVPKSAPTVKNYDNWLPDYPIGLTMLLQSLNHPLLFLRQLPNVKLAMWGSVISCKKIATILTALAQDPDFRFDSQWIMK